MNILKFESLLFLRRTMRLRRTSTPHVSLSAGAADKPDEETLRRMAEELQQKINRRNLDYGVIDNNNDVDVDVETPRSAPPQNSLASAASDPGESALRVGQGPGEETENASDIGRLIEADIAQWIAERRDIAELGQLYKGQNTDDAGQDDRCRGGPETERQRQQSLPHWREVRANALALQSQRHDELN